MKKRVKTTVIGLIWLFMLSSCSPATNESEEFLTPGFGLDQGVLEAQEQSEPTLWEEFPKMFTAEREYRVILTTSSLGAANTPLIYVLPDHSGLLIQVFGSSDTPPEIGEVFVDTQNQLWIGVGDFVSVSVPDETMELAPTVYKLSPMFEHVYSDLYQFVKNAYITGSTGEPVQATVADGIIIND